MCGLDFRPPIYFIYFFGGGGVAAFNKLDQPQSFFFFHSDRSVFSQYMSLFMQYARTLSTTTSKLSFCSKLASKLPKFRSCNYSLYNVNYRLLQNLFFFIQSLVNNIIHFTPTPHSSL